MKRRIQGSMLLELLLASAIGMLVIGLLVTTQIALLRNVQRTLNENTLYHQAYSALRTVREVGQIAMHAQVSNDGRQLTLILPRMDDNGNPFVPLTPDMDNPLMLNVNFAQGTLVMTHRGATRTLLTGLADRNAQGATYVPFTVSQVAPNIWVVHVRLSVRQGQGTTQRQIWYEETIFLRNSTQ